MIADQRLFFITKPAEADIVMRNWAKNSITRSAWTYLDTIWAGGQVWGGGSVGAAEHGAGGEGQAAGLEEFGQGGLVAAVDEAEGI